MQNKIIVANDTSARVHCLFFRARRKPRNISAAAHRERSRCVLCGRVHFSLQSEVCALAAGSASLCSLSSSFTTLFQCELRLMQSRTACRIMGTRRSRAARWGSHKTGATGSLAMLSRIALLSLIGPLWYLQSATFLHLVPLILGFFAFNRLFDRTSLRYIEKQYYFQLIIRGASFL